MVLSINPDTAVWITMYCTESPSEFYFTYLSVWDSCHRSHIWNIPHGMEHHWLLLSHHCKTEEKILWTSSLPLKQSLLLPSLTHTGLLCMQARYIYLFSFVKTTMSIRIESGWGSWWKVHQNNFMKYVIIALLISCKQKYLKNESDSRN